ncbi:tRNA (adenine(22)-N(1))-methyltransferase [Streptococcus massiliensis]|uniref:Bcl-2 family protein n=1 Tax=Streptococcus massiliensis TaxID=313439 RepID=A0A380KYU2_9STRE|nr:tRNA (adenine(22)-N(1))-methyltransferase TrmK [Streptococcus massiliensis]SUN75730.1 bcl-2 family protein [Streptococcus massiliensis]
MKAISQRLLKVASFVPDGARLLDVGSDHAYLPIYLTQQGCISFALAGEVVEGPFQSAQKNVQDEQLTDKIEVRLASGLAAFEPADQIDTIVIAGMGGRLIAEILENGRAKLPHISRLILQPNNCQDEVRSWLAEHGFQIVAEDILLEAGKYYEIIVAEEGQAALTAQEKRFGPYLVKEKSAIFQDKWQQELKKLELALARIPEKNRDERSAMSQKIQEIKEVLHVSK